MRATRLHGVGVLRTDEVVDPRAGDDDVVVQVAFNGICGTDLKQYFEVGPFGAGPQIMGHEFSGRVAAVGAAVRSLREGDRVAVRPKLNCGRCRWCSAGLSNLCREDDLGALGCGADGGGLAERAVVPADHAFLLPPELSLAQGALVEPMGVALNGVLRGAPRAGESAVVLGGGPVGIGVLLALRALGLRRVSVVEPSVARREIAARLGATEVFDPATTADATIRGSLGECGADLVFLCASSPEVMRSAVALLAPRGRIVLIATFLEGDVGLPAEALLRAEGTLLGSRGYADGVFEEVIALMVRGAYPTDGWVRTVPWSELVTGALEPLRSGAQTKVLVAIDPALEGPSPENGECG